MDDEEARLSKESKYFNMVIKPMLIPGHEGELCQWMKEMGLIRRGWRCNNKECVGPRGGSSGSFMVWSKARIIDKYTWTCRTCSKKLPIRAESFFSPFKCELKKILEAILCWCKRVHSEVAAKNVGLKVAIVNRIYDSCSQVAGNYVRAHSEDWKLGGEGVVVVVDVYPDGYMTSMPRALDTAKRKGLNRNRILCIAEISHIPSRIWVKVLDEDSSEASKSHALDQIVEHVLPRSTLVANKRADACSYEDVRKLKGFSNVFSVENLIELNLPGTRILQDNLETIWQSVVEVCDDSQELQKDMGHNLIDEFMWRQLIAQSSSSSVESILHQIAEQYSEKWKHKRLAC